MKLELTCDALELAHPPEGAGALSFGLPPGSAMVVLGRNGTGKSTLLRTLAGLDLPKRGAVTLGSEPVAKMPPKRRAAHLAFVSSTPPGGAALTVQEVIELALEAGGHPTTAAHVQAALDHGGIASWADKSIDTLSDGMAQKVMLARASTQADSVVLLDEPTAFLDVVGRREVMAAVGAWRDQGKSVVLATHDLDAVEEAGWASRWMVMRPPAEGGTLIMESPFTSSAAKQLLTAKGGAV